jgi:hypothetical protein
MNMGTLLSPWRCGEIRQDLSESLISQGPPSVPTWSLAHLQLGKMGWPMPAARPPMQTYNGGAIESGQQNDPSGLLMSWLRGIAVDAFMTGSPHVMVPDFGTCIVHAACGIRRVGTCRAARPHKTHLAGGGWRAFVQDIAIRIDRAVHALRKRRGRQNDRHQRCGNERFIVHRCFHFDCKFQRPGLLTDLLFRRG